MTAKFGWSKAVLIHQIENQSYEKTLLDQTNFDRALAPALRVQAKLAVKDEYTVDFLELGDQHSERELASKLESDTLQDERDLGWMLTGPEMAKIFGEGMAFDLRGLLVERFGLNLRNDLAHGLLARIWDLKEPCATLPFQVL